MISIECKSHITYWKSIICNLGIHGKPVVIPRDHYCSRSRFPEVKSNDFEWHHRQRLFVENSLNIPNSNVHGANMGPTWGRQDPGGPHVGPMSLVIWDCFHHCMCWPAFRNGSCRRRDNKSRFPQDTRDSLLILLINKHIDLTQDM